MGWKKWLGPALAPALALAAQGVPDASGAAGAVKVQRHASRWKYPQEVSPARGQKLHTVEKGDTLWDLGRKYLASPYAWPQIWELNRWVEDPHWIYPGDPLLIPLESTAIGADDGPASAVADLLPDRPAGARAGAGYAYAFQDFLRLPYLAPKGAAAHFKERRAIRITGAQKEERRSLSRGDVVYLGGGRDRGLQVGDRLVVLKVAARGVAHPDGGKALGDVVQHAAVLRVMALHPRNAEAAVEAALDGVDVGDFAAALEPPALIRAKDAPLRTDTREPIKPGAAAKVIYGRNGATLLGAGDMVLIDGGGRKGIAVGDVLLALRERPMSEGGILAPPATNRYLGQLLVVRADDRYSTCLIISSKTEITPGDTVTK
jgi:LysM repeat protein